jgi:metal-responsive CopG/Arc/MetJ family transcriptional regulator
MSRVVSGGLYQRKRPTCSITINDTLLSYIDDLARKAHVTRSQVIETAIRLAMKDKQLERTLLGDLAELKQRSEKEDVDKAQQLSERFMRRLLTDPHYLEGEWTPIA